MAGLLKGQVLTPKFTTVEITDSDDRIHYVPLKHTIGDYFLVEIEGKFFAFTMKNARILTHRSKSGLGKAFQVIQYDTSNFSSLSPTTKELELMLHKNSLPKMDRRMHNILQILARREKNDFGMYQVGEEMFETEKDAQKYLNSLSEEQRKWTYVDSDGDEVTEKLKVTHNVHSIDELVKVFEAEKGEFPDQVREIKKYLKGLDVDYIVTPLRRITDFIQRDLIATDPTFLAEGITRYQRMDGQIHDVTNVPVKPKSNIMKYMMFLMPVIIGVLIIFIGMSEGWFDDIIAFTDNLGTIQEGFKGLPAPGQFQSGTAGKVVGGIDYSDAAIQSAYPSCEAITEAINSGILDYNKLTESMKGLVDTC